MNAQNIEYAPALRPWFRRSVLFTLLDVKTYLARRLVAVSDAITDSHFQAFPDQIPETSRERVFSNLETIIRETTELGLPLTRLYAERLLQGVKRISSEELTASLGELQCRFDDEIREIAFLYVPVARMAFYGKDATEVLGALCQERFPSTIPEIDEAMKCFAVGRFTACVFHLSRATEAAARALGIVLGAKMNNTNWGNILKEYDKQLAAAPSDRPSAWSTHGAFLEELGSDLRALKAFRNGVALDESYSEERAEFLIAVIPEFLRQAAKGMNEDGELL